MCAADRCAVISPQEAATILGVAAGDLDTSRRQLLVSPRDVQRGTYAESPYSCRISARSDFLRVISYTVSRFNDPGEARRAFVAMRQNYTTVTSDLSPVDLPGGEAFRVEDSRFHRLLAIRGAVLVDVLNPADAALQRRILSLVLEAR